MEAEYQINGSNEHPDPEPDYEAQRAARDAIMGIPAFPELMTRLTQVLGPTVERDIVHQLVYWFSKPKMQHRWWAYLTRENWRDQRGLNRKQVDKGRRRLKAHPSGMVEEKMGPYKRVHYRVDWVALADVLRTPLKGVPMEDDFDFFEDFEEEVLRPPLKGTPKPSDPPLGDADPSAPPQMDDAPDTYPENSPKGGVPSNTGAYAVAFSQDNPTAVAAEPTFAEPAAREINGKEEKEDSSSPVGDKRHSQNGHAPSETTATKVKVAEPVAPPKPDDDTLLAEVRELLNPDSGRWWAARFVTDEHKPEKLAKYIVDETEIERGETVDGAPPEELEAAIRYVMWLGEEL